MKYYRDWNRKEFYIQFWIVISISIIFLISCISYLLDILGLYSFDLLNELIINKFLINREGILVSIAAIFIGIYFTIFTLLLSIKPDSTIIQMGTQTYKELLAFIKHAFIGAFLYIVYAILYPLIDLGRNVGLFKFSYELILAELVIYMLLSALRVGMAFFIIFKFDLKKFFNDVDKELQSKEEQKEVMSKLKRFLEVYEMQESLKKAEEINAKAPFKNPKTQKK